MHAVLISGGLDSAILLGELLRSGRAVRPLFVRCGLFWEDVELTHLQRFLTALAGPGLAPLVLLDVPTADLYGDHWSATGRDVPDEHSPDDAVFLPGRNILLASKALLWCHLQGVETLSLGSLGTNPFPDATEDFFDSLAAVVNQAVGGRVRLERPFARSTKNDVMRLGAAFPLEHTFSCIRPENGRHCGRCNKCAERKAAFAGANLRDPTDYAVPAQRTSHGRN